MMAGVMGERCGGCGIQATEDQIFKKESLPFRRPKTFCPNCHARFQRRVFQFVLILDLVMGAAGLAMIWRNPYSEPGNVFFNLFLFEAFFILATLPHELGHAWVGRQIGFDVRKVIVGFGTTIVARKIFGFDIEFKRIPFGGITIGFPLGAKRARTRCFLFVLAGPLANFVLSAGAYLLAPKGSMTFDLGRSLRPWPLFLLANLVVVVCNLIPFVASTAYGRISSDGLALFQLAFLRRLPFVPNQELGRFAMLARGLRRLIKWVATVFLSLCSLLCFGIAALLARDLMSKEADAALWFAVCLFTTLGTVLGWFVFRVWQAPAVTRAVNPYASPSPYSEIIRSYQADVQRNSLWPQGVSPQALVTGFNQLKIENKLSEAELLIDDALQKTPENLTLILLRLDIPAAENRWNEVEAMLGSILTRADLSSATRTVLLAGQIKAILKG